MKRLLIIGAGGHGHALAEAAAGDFAVIGFLDDAFPTLNQVSGFPVLGKLADFSDFNHLIDCVIIAFGNNALRQRLALELKKTGVRLASVIHPKAIISPSASIGEGVAVMAGAVVGSASYLGDGVIVNCNAVVDHDCRVGSFAHLGIGALMAGGATLGALAWMKAGSILSVGTKIADEVVLQPGEVVNQ